MIGRLGMVLNVIVEKDGKWFVESEKGKNLGGPYDTKAEAEERLKEVEAFKHMDKKNQLQQIITNVKPITRIDNMEDKEWVVVPMIMLMEGVHNGSCGALYYPEEELEKTPQAWNHKPVVVYHPEGPTACDPDILTNRKIGVIMNTKYEDHKLKAEAWIDASRCKKIDNRVMEAIEKGEMMELSTGLFTDAEGPAGDWKGEEYDAVAKNYRPDHLALLPDLTGACSVADGAGFLRCNAEKTEERISENWVQTYFPILNAAGIDTEKLVRNELSHSDLWRLLYAELQKQDKNAWLEEVYDTFIIYNVVPDSGLYRRFYEKTGDSAVQLKGVAESVMRVVEYKVKPGINNEIRKDNKMSKEELIAKLIGNAESGWKNEDKEVLNSMNETQLEALCKKIPEPKVDNKEPEKKEPEVKVDNKEPEKKEPVVQTVVNNEPKKPMTEQEYIAAAPKNIQNVLSHGLKAYNAERDRLIETITKNPRNQFAKDWLVTKEIEELRGLASLATVNDEPTSDAPSMFDFRGQAEPAKNDENVPVLTAPTMNFESK